MNFEKAGFALDIMWKGMLGIFVVIILVMLSTLVIGAIGNYIEERKNKVAEPQDGNN